MSAATDDGDDMDQAVSDLIARSNRLGADPRNTNYAGGNTSAKGVATDPATGQPVELVWVKGSGGDLGTLTPAGLAALRLDPELGPGAVQVPTWLALTGPGVLGAQPRLVHVRRSRVAAVADDVDELGVRERRRQEWDEEDVGGRLLGEAQVAVSLDAHEPAVHEPEEPA